MNREAILNKYSNEEDRLFVAKIIDKINFAKKSNSSNRFSRYVPKENCPRSNKHSKRTKL